MDFKSTVCSHVVNLNRLVIYLNYFTFNSSSLHTALYHLYECIDTVLGNLVGLSHAMNTEYPGNEVEYWEEQ